MPKRTDIQSILLIGAGPIVIGQACEFDYSGTQACRALKAEGYRVILVNSNPATIMTDPDMADATYIEPIEWQTVKEIIKKERPDVLLPTMGGQTALNCALDLVREGVLAEYGVSLIGATREAIDMAEDRALFRECMKRINLKTPRSGLAHSMADAWTILEEIGFPAVIRPSFTMGGTGSGIAYNRDEYESICLQGLELSPTTELLIDESIIGWKEYELEVVRDRKDNCIVVCTIENVDAMGIHTGDSITVAPAQTLTDKEYQRLRDAAFSVIRAVGVETGGANVQFAIHPRSGDVMVVEMNPRVSRSSALSSKATGFPIAKVAALLAVGYTLDELKNEITQGVTPASFEPALDYVIVKMPRFSFEKFPGASTRLTTQMKSVGEVMAIGRTFQEALQKAIRGLELGYSGLHSKLESYPSDQVESILRRELRIAGPDRLWYVADAFRWGVSIDQVSVLTGIDHWYLAQIEELIQIESQLKKVSFDSLTAVDWRAIKAKGFSDTYLALLWKTEEARVRLKRQKLGVRPVYKCVDSVAGELPSTTSYFYSTYETVSEAVPTSRQSVMILGGGPNRIGQGIEFDYCCVHAAFALRKRGYDIIMVNCNPETVSTDHDISDHLYFESLTLEDVLEIVALENPVGVVVQFGGQTPLKLARALEAAGVPIIGTSPDAIDRAEDRERFQAFIYHLKLLQPPSGIVRTVEEGVRLANVFAYPLMVRPSYVLGGQQMKVIYTEGEFLRYLKGDVDVSPDRPLLLDHFLDQAIEVDVDAVCDGHEVFIGGILEHIEQAGVHSGDSSCVLPPHSLDEKVKQTLRDQVTVMALELGVVGLLNVQFAIRDHEIYVLEVNPRASRTVPFVAKATGVCLAQVALDCMLGCRLQELGYIDERVPTYCSIKQAIFPFARFLDVDPILGPEMRSTGEVMGIGDDFGEAFAKGQLSSGKYMPKDGCAFLSVRDQDKPFVSELARALVDQGFSIVTTGGTFEMLQAADIPCAVVNKVMEGRPNIVDMIKNDEIQFIVNTTEGEQAIADSYMIRRSAIQHKVCYTTTLAGGKAACAALQIPDGVIVRSLQELHALPTA